MATVAVAVVVPDCRQDSGYSYPDPAPAPARGSPAHSITYPLDFEPLARNEISCVSCEDDICLSVANEMNLTRVN